MNRFALSVLQVFGVLMVGALLIASPDRQIKWVVLGIETAFYFGFICHRTWEFWHNAQYWLFFCSVLAIHLVGAIWIQRGRPIIPGAIYLVVGFVEAMALYGAIVFLFNE